MQRAARASFASQPPPEKLSYTKVPKEDFGQYAEYSVIFTNRALNLMSDPFQKVMRDLNKLLKVTYNADRVAIIPGCVRACLLVCSLSCVHFHLHLSLSYRIFYTYLQLGYLWHGVCGSAVCHERTRAGYSQWLVLLSLDRDL